MAVFLINICKFNGCGITFPSLGDLIQHIEDTHIDYDPKVIEQKELSQPACLPLSYVLRFITDAARKERPFLGSNGVELKRKMAIKHHSYSMSSSNRSNTPTGSELDEDEMVNTESEDSNDSWTTEEFSSEFIMRYGSRHSGSSNGTQGNEKPFACPVPGCKKRYKNVNGIKYHSKNGHKKDGKVRKGYKCHCGKSYKTAQGLKSHALVTHNSSPENSVSNTVVRSLSPSQSIGSLSPSSISNMSNSNSSCNNISNNNCNIMSVNQMQPLSNLTNSHTAAQSNNCNSGNGLMRNNIGLISIKTTKSANLIAANVAANKILKIASNTTTTSTISSSVITAMENNSIGITTTENGKLKFDIASSTAISNKIDLPSLVNLGILTPATSPNKPHATTFQSAVNVNTNTNSNSLHNNQSNNNLPLTPISPNLQTKTITIATSNINKNSTITLNGNIGSGSGNGCIGSVGLSGSVNLITGGGVGGGSSGKGIHISSHGGGITDKLIGEDT